MHFTTAISSLALLVSSVAAYPYAQERAVLADNPALEITGLVINDTTTGNTLLKFNVTNPETLANPDIASCSGRWNHTAQDWPVSSNSVRIVEPVLFRTC